MIYGLWVSGVEDFPEKKCKCLPDSVNITVLRIFHLSALTKEKKLPMNREYDLFERLPDGAPMWLGCAKDAEEAREKLMKVAETTKSELFAMDLETKEVVFRVQLGQIV